MRTLIAVTMAVLAAAVPVAPAAAKAHKMEAGESYEHQPISCSQAGRYSLTEHFIAEGRHDVQIGRFTGFHDYHWSFLSCGTIDYNAGAAFEYGLQGRVLPYMGAPIGYIGQAYFLGLSTR